MFIKTTIAFVAAATFSMSAMAWQPSGKVECLAPADPGGGWDFTCRSVGNVMQQLDLVEGSVQTVNMAGAGGGVAYAHTVSKRKNDDKLIVAASTATTTRLAQKQFPGMDASMVKWIGALGADYGIIAVGKDSKYENLTQLMDALKADPRSVKFAGGSARGGWDHLKVLIAAKGAARLMLSPVTCRKPQALWNPVICVCWRYFPRNDCPVSLVIFLLPVSRVLMRLARTGADSICRKIRLQKLSSIG